MKINPFKVVKIYPSIILLCSMGLFGYFLSEKRIVEIEKVKIEEKIIEKETIIVKDCEGHGQCFEMELFGAKIKVLHKNNFFTVHDRNIRSVRETSALKDDLLYLIFDHLLERKFGEDKWEGRLKCETQDCFQEEVEKITLKIKYIIK